MLCIHTPDRLNILNQNSHLDSFSLFGPLQSVLGFSTPFNFSNVPYLRIVLLVKTSPRLYSYIVAFQVIKDYQLMGIVCILVGLDVLVLTVWEFTDPLKIVRYNKTLEIIVSI